jgi:hypothetical protein
MSATTPLYGRASTCPRAIELPASSLTAVNQIRPRVLRSQSHEQVTGPYGIHCRYLLIRRIMLYTVWTNFGAAELNVNLEANALRNMFRLAEGLPAPQREQLATQARAYADAVVNQDWPMMARGQIAEGSHEINERTGRAGSHRTVHRYFYSTATAFRTKNGASPADRSPQAAGCASTCKAAHRPRARRC